MVRFFQVLITIVCGLAAIMNALLIPIIVYSSYNNFGIYKFLMLALASFALFCAALAVVNIPLILTTHNGILYFSTVSYFPKWIDEILLCAYVATYISWSLILIYSFLYRSLAVRHKEQLLFYRNGYIILTIILIIVWFLFAKLMYSFPASQGIMDQLRSRAYNLTGLEMTTLAAYCGVFFEEDGSFGAGFYVSVTIASYALPMAGVMILCVYLFYSYTTTNDVFSYLSTAIQSRQKRLFLHLIAQTIAPLLFTTTPILTSYVIGFIGVEFSDAFYLVLASLIPTAHVLDPLLMFLFIQEYRTIPYEMMKRLCWGEDDRKMKLFDMNNPTIQLPFTIFTTASTILNGVLILLIIMRSQVVLGGYKNLLLVYTCIGFFSSLSLVVTLPVVMPTSRGLLFFNTVQRLPQRPTTVAICTFSVSFVMWAVILTYSFLYRCLAVRSRERIIFNRRGWIAMILVAISTAVFFSWICSNFGPSDDTLDLLADRVYNITTKDVHTLSFVGGEFFTVTPLVFSFAPALAVTALTFFSIDVTDAVNYVLSFMLMITQLLDPLWIFYFITDYRKAIFFLCQKTKKEVVYAPEHSTSISRAK